MRILAAGDIHGDPQHLLYLYETAARLDVDRIFALGDYGYWEHMQGGGDYLDFNSQCAAEYDIPTYWLDGNHENHVLLRNKYGKDGMRDRPWREFWEIREDVHYSPRGNRFTWDGVTFLTLGGAYSVDRASRRVGTSFWFEEMIENEEVDRSIRGGKVDVMLAHDLPSGVDMAAIMNHRGFRYTAIPSSEWNRDQLRKVVDEVRPDYFYHGHYHTRYRQDIVVARNHLMQVRGLGCNGMGADSWTIIDTADLNPLARLELMRLK